MSFFKVGDKVKVKKDATFYSSFKAIVVDWNSHIDIFDEESDSNVVKQLVNDLKTGLYCAILFDHPSLQSGFVCSPYYVIDINNLELQDKLCNKSNSVVDKELWNSFCFKCGAPAYIGAFDMDCSNKNCK